MILALSYGGYENLNIISNEKPTTDVDSENGCLVDVEFADTDAMKL